MTGSCNNLFSYSSFASYIKELRHVTSQNLTINSMEPCKLEICSALFGVGNSDISGVGVITAYILSLSLGFILALLTTFHHPTHQRRSIPDALHESFSAYADAAILLTFSIQLASVIILVKKDYGISASDFGSLTVQVTWAAALLTMLPTLFICCCGAQLERKDLKLALTSVSWILFVYTFVSRMIDSYSPSQVGPPSSSSPQHIITSAEWSNIETLCFTSQSTLSHREQSTFTAFAIGGSLLVSLALLSALIWTALANRQPHLTKRWSKLPLLKSLGTPPARAALVCNVLLWAIPQIWAILRFRAMQQALAFSVKTADQDGSWSFGQIVSVVIFLPVFIEFVYVYCNEPPDCHCKDAKPGEAKVI